MKWVTASLKYVLLSRTTFIPYSFSLDSIAQWTQNIISSKYIYLSRNDLWMNEWCTYYCCTHKALYNHVCVCVCGGGGGQFFDCLQKNQTFILTGCREYLYISVCIWYEDSFTQMEWWNAHKVTLRAVLDRDAPIDRPVIRIVRFRTWPAWIGDRLVSLTSCRFQKNKLKRFTKYDLGKQH